MKQVKNINTKFIIVILFIILIFAFIGFYYISHTSNVKLDLQNEITKQENELVPFQISKIYLYSSADAIQNTVTNNASWNVNVSQFTDIAIFINNNCISDSLNPQNTLQGLYLNNFKYTVMPTLGTPTLYYKNQNDFGRMSYNKEKEISDSLNYAIIDYDEELNFSNPETYDSSISPICIGFINCNVKENYSINNTEDSLLYDGSLLRRCYISLSSISCSLSFDIHIINQLGEHFISSVNIDIPLKDSNSDKTIYDGYLVKELTDLVNYNFYKM